MTRERVLQAALELADAGGFEALSMRNVAKRLGVQAMSLYHHVAGKEDLVDGLIDIVLAEIEVAAPGELRWRPATRGRAISVREALTRHPWAIGRLCPRNGHAFSVVDAYIHGFALQERSLPQRDDDETEFEFGLDLILDGLERRQA